MLALAIAAPLALSGCAAPANDPNLTPAQNQLRQANRNWYAAVLTGAGVGAATGAAAGALAGGNRGQNALIGAAIGLAVGTVGGLMVANRNYEFANAQLNATQRIDAANAMATRLEQLADSADATVAQNRRTLAELDRQYRARQITAAEYNQRTAQMRADQQEMQTAVERAKDMRVQMNQSRAQVPGMRQAEERLGPAQRRLEASAAELDEMLSKVPSI